VVHVEEIKLVIFVIDLAIVDLNSIIVTHV